MALSVVLRMTIGLVVLIVLARELGPKAFGFVGTVFAYATLASLLTDFGLSVKMLRDISARPDLGADILSNSLSVKAVLTVAVSAVGVAILWASPFPQAAKFAAALLSLGILAASVGDLAMSAYRAVGKYSAETRIVAATSAIYLVVVPAIATYTEDVLAVSAAFLFCRVLYAASAVIGAEWLFKGIRLRLRSFSQLARTIYSSRYWALDSGLNHLGGQLDNLLVAHVLGMSAAGIYQGGGRFVQASFAISGILANVHIPTMTKIRDFRRVNSTEAKVIVEYVLVGATLAAALFFAGPIFSTRVLGPEYIDVRVLWPGFAAFVMMRYAAGGLGAALTAAGAVKLRTLGQALSILAVLIASVGLSHGRLAFAPWMMTIGAGVNVLVYALARVSIMKSPR